MSWLLWKRNFEVFSPTQVAVRERQPLVRDDAVRERHQRKRGDGTEEAFGPRRLVVRPARACGSRPSATRGRRARARTRSTMIASSSQSAMLASSGRITAMIHATIGMIAKSAYPILLGNGRFSTGGFIRAKTKMHPDNEDDARPDEPAGRLDPWQPVGQQVGHRCRSPPVQDWRVAACLGRGCDGLPITLLAARAYRDIGLGR